MKVTSPRPPRPADSAALVDHVLWVLTNAEGPVFITAIGPAVLVPIRDLVALAAKVQTAEALPEHYRELVAARTGDGATDEQRSVLRKLWWTGKRHSEETREKMRVARRAQLAAIARKAADSAKPGMTLPLAVWAVASLVGVALWLVILAACASAQAITAEAQLKNGIAELRIANPAASPLAVEMALFRDATLPGQPVTLGDSVSALISPRTFTLQPGEVQVVRIRVNDTVQPGTLLRLATLFTPQDHDAPGEGAVRLLVRTRLITRVRAAP